MFILEELFCPIDDFCLLFEPSWRKQLIQSGMSHRLRNRQLSLSETMTILVSFHISNCRNFKAFYLSIVKHYWRNYFPNLVSYQRFIEKIQAYYRTVNNLSAIARAVL